MASSDPHAWWKQGVLYQIYPRSWADSDGNGIGDIQGIIGRLDHLSRLGVEGIWLNPTMPSPNRDWGYDVSDYTAVHPDLGDLGDLDELVSRAEERGVRVLLDLVPNHTSDLHPWFEEARRSRSSTHRDFYLWADPREDGSEPNNWLSAFDGPAWTFDDLTGQYYMHNFLPSQPDLNWWNPEVRLAFDDILRFWFDRGIAGFRIDVAHGIYKDRHLRDDPDAADDDHPVVQLEGRRRVYSMNRPETHGIFKHWRRIADSYDPPRLLVGETYVWDLPSMASYHGDNDELHLTFNIPFLMAPFDADALRTIVEETERLLPPGAWPVWAGSNHDVGRFPSRWCGDDAALIRCALVMLLTLRGTPFLYYGDEIGMGNVVVPGDRARDPAGRDPGRTPMQWSAAPGAGFTREGVEPWLPVGEPATNAADQDGDDASPLSLVRELIRLRREHPDLRRGPYRTLPSLENTWAYARGGAIAVALNLGDRPARFEEISGRVLLRTDPGHVRNEMGVLEVAPREASVVLLG